MALTTKWGQDLNEDEISQELIKVFGTDELNGEDRQPLPIDKLRKLISTIKESGLAHWEYNTNGDIKGAIIRFPLADKQFEIVV